MMEFFKLKDGVAGNIDSTMASNPIDRLPETITMLTNPNANEPAITDANASEFLNKDKSTSYKSDDFEKF